MIRKLQSGEYRLYSRKKDCQNWQAQEPWNVQNQERRAGSREGSAIL